MASYAYTPLSDTDEIRVLILEPSQDKTAPLRGSLKKIRLPIDASSSFNPNSPAPTISHGDPCEASGSSSVSSGKAQWKWKFKATSKILWRNTVHEDGCNRCISEIYPQRFIH